MRLFIAPSDWRPRGIDELEPAADWSVRSQENTAVVAGPGAGKTELLAQRACFLLETGVCVPPRRILAISFKRDAARNLRDRVEQRAGSELGRRLDSYTFDAFAKSILDQFLRAVPSEVRPTADYEVLLGSPRAEQIADVLVRMEPPNALGGATDPQSFASEAFYKRKVLQVALTVAAADLEHWAAQEFWRRMLFGGPRSRLYFGMINRLALGIIRRDARVRRAYRATYSHVFLDEFQDTTQAQYTLTCALFHGTPTLVTAVGDPQQRIMGWAGALRNAFEAFVPDFRAITKRLERNRRASAQIAPVVRFLAARLRDEDGKAESAEIAALEGGGPPPEACGAFLFDDDESEAEWIADQIEVLLEEGVAPRDICILARNRVPLYTASLLRTLANRGVEARVEDALQDLLSEPLVRMLMLAMRALLTRRPGAGWVELREELAALEGIDDDDAMSALDNRLSLLRRSLRERVPSGFDEVLEVLSDLQQLFVVSLRNRYAQYQRGSFYADTIAQLASQLAGRNAGASWERALDSIEGGSSIPMMSIHKSKGLEYVAVFFVGLEDGAFWSFGRSRSHAVEELNAFFVAISRAKARVAFTYAKRRALSGSVRRQSRDEIRELYDLMHAAGVRLVELGAR